MKKTIILVLAMLVITGLAMAGVPSEPYRFNPDRGAIERCVRAAMDDAGRAPGQIDLLLPSRNGVTEMDRAEDSAMRGVFGEPPRALAEGIVRETKRSATAYLGRPGEVDAAYPPSVSAAAGMRVGELERLIEDVLTTTRLEATGLLSGSSPAAAGARNPGQIGRLGMRACIGSVVHASRDKGRRGIEAPLLFEERRREHEGQIDGGEQRVTPQVEEVVADPDGLYREQLLPDMNQLGLGRIFGRSVGVVEPRPLEGRGRKSRAIDL